MSDVCLLSSPLCDGSGGVRPAACVGAHGTRLPKGQLVMADWNRSLSMPVTQLLPSTSWQLYYTVYRTVYNIIDGTKDILRGKQSMSISWAQ